MSAPRVKIRMPVRNSSENRSRRMSHQAAPGRVLHCARLRGLALCKAPGVEHDVPGHPAASQTSQPPPGLALCKTPGVTRRPAGATTKRSRWQDGMPRRTNPTARWGDCVERNGQKPEYAPPRRKPTLRPVLHCARHRGWHTVFHAARRRYEMKPRPPPVLHCARHRGGGTRCSTPPGAVTKRSQARPRSCTVQDTGGGTRCSTQSGGTEKRRGILTGGQTFLSARQEDGSGERTDRNVCPPVWVRGPARNARENHSGRSLVTPRGAEHARWRPPAPRGAGYQ